MSDETTPQGLHIKPVQPVTSEAPISETPHENEDKKQENPIWEVIKFFILALVIVLPIRTFIAQPFIVEGRSMDPTFNTGQYLIVDELSYRFSDPERGDVIILRFPNETTKYFIKRVIGMPGERLVLEGNTVRIYTPSNPIPIELNEPYVTHPIEEGRRFNYSEVQLADDEYFVMGDNRSASSDSRDWGPLKENLVVGEALLRLFPISTASVHPGATTYPSIN